MGYDIRHLPYIEIHWLIIIPIVEIFFHQKKHSKRFWEPAAMYSVRTLPGLSILRLAEPPTIVPLLMVTG